MGLLAQYLKYGARLIRKNPRFAVASILALSLGIGVNTIIFSIVNSVLLNQLPFRSPEQLLWIWGSRTDRDKAFFSIPNYIDTRDQSTMLEDMSGFTSWGVNQAGRGEPQRFQGVRITANAFQMLGVNAVIGRSLEPADDRPDALKVVVLTYRIWEQRFGSDPDILNTSLILNEESYMVVGVLPPNFVFPGEPDAEIATPFKMDVDPRKPQRGSNFIRVLARMKPGASIQQVQSELSGITHQLRAQYAENNKMASPKVLSLLDELVGGYRTALFMLQGAVALVLLIACTNLANLQLSVASSRRKEIAIRMALGASRKEIIKQLVTESLLISFIGGAIGLLLAWKGIPFVLTFLPNRLPRSNEISVDLTVLGFTLAISVAASFFFGLLPAVQSSKVDFNEEIKGTTRGSGGSAIGKRTRNLLVTAEVALSLVLLINAGLLIRSFVRILEINPGFKPDQVLLMSLSLPQKRYSDPDSVRRFYENVQRHIAAVPAVNSVAVVSVPPLSSLLVSTDFTIVGHPPPSPDETPGAQNRWVSPDYFKTLNIPIKRGREFTSSDILTAQGVVVIDEAAQQAYFQELDPIGMHLRIFERDFEIVGIVGNVKHFNLDESPLPTLYAPFYQIPPNPLPFFLNRMNIAVRAEIEPLSLAREVRRAVHAVDSEIPAYSTRTMDQYISGAIAPRQFTLLLLGLFTAIALVLAALGVYAVISYAVSRRTNEIGIRMAIGASPSQITRMVVGEGMRPIIYGIFIGLIGGFLLARLISSLLFGIGVLDLPTYLITPVILVVVGLLATIFPAMRAIKVNPVIALKSE
jgi:putative ABC transport system permease protein